MPHQHEGDLNPVVQASLHSPVQVLHEEPVFVLSRTVVCMQDKIELSEVVMAEEVMEEAYDAVCTLANAAGLINEVIDLCI